MCLSCIREQGKPKLYIVSADVHRYVSFSLAMIDTTQKMNHFGNNRSFDNVDHNKLIEVLKDMFTEVSSTALCSVAFFLISSFVDEPL